MSHHRVSFPKLSLSIYVSVFALLLVAFGVITNTIRLDVGASFSSAAGSYIKAFPNPCSIQPGKITCASTVTWFSSEYSQPCVFSSNSTGGIQRLVACGKSGSQDYYLVPASGFVFTFRANSSPTSRIIAPTLKVWGNASNPPKNPYGDSSF